MNRRWWIAFAMVATLWGCQERIDPVGPRDLAESAGKGSGKGGGTPSVTVTVLLAPGSGPGAEAFGVNDGGSVVGFVTGYETGGNEPYSFLWNGGGVRSLGLQSYASDVAANGLIVGYTWPARGGVDRAAVWDPSLESWEQLPGPSGEYSYADGISDDAEWVSGRVGNVPVVWRKGTGGWSLTILDTEEGNAEDVNDSGLVVGTVGPLVGLEGQAAAVWTSTGLRQLLAPLGANRPTAAEGVNNQGDIVGQACDVDGKFKAVVWRRAGNGWSTPEIISDPKWIRRFDSSTAVDISDAGKIVLNHQASGGMDAFLWDPNTRKRIALGGGEAFAINEFNQIVGKSGNKAVMWTLP